jgi:hypothetical protein
MIQARKMGIYLVCLTHKGKEICHEACDLSHVHWNLHQEKVSWSTGDSRITVIDDEVSDDDKLQPRNLMWLPLVNPMPQTSNS